MNEGKVFPEKKATALILRTDDSRGLEKIIKDILKLRGQHVENTEGTEWYTTSPAEVEDIYHNILSP